MRSITASVGRNAPNRPSDVSIIQRLLNFKVNELSMQPMRVDGKPSEILNKTIEGFQGRIMKVRRPDGVIDPGKRTLKRLLRMTVAQRATYDREWIVEWAPPWIRVAASQLGVHELRGVKKNSPQVLKYIATVPSLKTCDIEIKGKTYICADVDESSWCGCFVNWCLIQAGYPGHAGINAARAKEWKSYGKDLELTPKYGAIICVYANIKNHGYNHVGFYLGERNGKTIILGGNQENGGKPGGRVCVSEFSGWTTKRFVWPQFADDDE